MNPLVELNLALILFLPWCAILGVLFWLYPRQPRPPTRRWFDAGAMALSLLAFVLTMHWGHGWADPGYGHMWRQIVATSAAYGAFLAVLAVAVWVRWGWLRGRAR
jgi:hypothetical protein